MEDPEPDSWPAGSPFTPDAPSPFTTAAQSQQDVAPCLLEALRPSCEQAPVSDTIGITDMGAHNRAATAKGHADTMSTAGLGWRCRMHACKGVRTGGSPQDVPSG